MSSTSSGQAARDADSEVYRLADPADDDDANGAPTKVGPMSKAFVDQMMFKAQLAESADPASRRPISTSPSSGPRPTGVCAEDDEVEPSPALPESGVLEGCAGDGGLHDAGLPLDSAPVAAAAHAVWVPPPQPAPGPSVNAVPPVVTPASAYQLEPAYSMNGGRWTTMLPETRPQGDRRMAVEVTVVLATLGVTIAAVVIGLFP